ncbi:hypothetical protein BLNAU_5020 [Blattamonas nauphoetae]|uniref:Uncharacterized protein n=1 Tax=Blattamonas nauphoetae TaxID=2049346 RepID=A0ABQ9Y8Q1_9EUKA|nr:hypothetical protein BLNAU_5020 [Blattamonas nauphoetae]
MHSGLSFEEKSAIYCSLVALVKAEYPFDNALQDRAALFLKSLEPEWADNDLPAKLITNLVPSSDGSPSGFVESIVTLLSSPHSTVVAAALSFLNKTMGASKPPFRLQLVESDFVTTVNGTILSKLVKIIDSLVGLAYRGYHSDLGITAAVDIFNLFETIFQKVVLPSCQHSSSSRIGVCSRFSDCDGILKLSLVRRRESSCLNCSQ